MVEWITSPLADMVSTPHHRYHCHHHHLHHKHCNGSYTPCSAIGTFPILTLTHTNTPTFSFDPLFKTHCFATR